MTETIPQAVVANSQTRWILRLVLWIIAVSAIIGLLTWSLHHRAHPWELVFERSSGLDPKHADFYHASHDGGPVDLSSDGRYLAVGRLGGDCEIWDLDEGPRLIKSLGLRLPHYAREYMDHFGTRVPVYDDVVDVRWLHDAKHIAMYRRSEWEIFDLDGKSIVSPATIPSVYQVARSLVSSKIAFADHARVVVVDPNTRRVDRAPSLGYFNGGNQRLEYSHDDRFLLLNDHLGLRVWDMQEPWKLVFHHRELDFSLPPPMIADEHSGIEAFDNKKREKAYERRLAASQPTSKPSSLSNSLFDTGGIKPGDFATLLDSRFSPDGSCIATIYRPDSGFAFSLGGGNPQGSRLRFYETATGRLFWDTQLSDQPTAMVFSDDGKRLYVYSAINAWPSPNYLFVFDTASKAQLRRMLLPEQHTSMPTLVALTGDRVAICGADELWVVSGSDRFAPFRLRDAEETCAVKVSPDGKRIVVVGNDLRARVYRERRPQPVWGAFGLAETWGIYLAVAMLLLGAVKITASQLTFGSVPRALWWAAILWALWYTLIISDDLVDWAIDGIYNEPERWKWTAIFPKLFTALGIVAMLGALRLNRGWWKCWIVLLSFALLINAGFAALFLVAAYRGITGTDTTLVIHGLRVGSAWTVGLAMVIMGIIWLIVELRLVVHASVRAAMPRPTNRWSDNVRGFEVRA